MLDIFVIVYLDNILVYTEDPSHPHVNTGYWVLERLRKQGLFANLKKCRFHQDEMRFSGFVVSAQSISIEEKRVEVVKAWPEPKSIRDIQGFLGFANFYQRFNQGYNKIASPLTSMLKTTLTTGAGTLPKTDNDSIFLIPEVNLGFLRLKQAFTEASILYHFDPERYIRIKPDASSYTIGGILSPLIPESVQWHLIAFFLKKNDSGGDLVQNVRSRTAGHS